MSESEATVFPVTALSEIETVAPVAFPADCGIHTPPPSSTVTSGSVVLTPPVIVTPLIETVGSVAPK